MKIKQLRISPNFGETFNIQKLFVLKSRILIVFSNQPHCPRLVLPTFLTF